MLLPSRDDVLPIRVSARGFDQSDSHHCKTVEAARAGEKRQGQIAVRSLRNSPGK
jgi:hypothetical protein